MDSSTGNMISQPEQKKHIHQKSLPRSTLDSKKFNHTPKNS